jgi:hypothetical protein
LPLEQLQKLIKYPFEQIAWGICELHATFDNVSIISLGELNLKFEKCMQVLKLCLPSAVFIPMRACPTIPL